MNREASMPMLPTLKILVFGRNPRLTFWRALATAVLLCIVCTQILLPTRIVGGSMEPTIHNGSIHAIFLLRYRWATPRRGDIICIRLAGRHVSYAKRILAAPGDRIAFRNDRLFINGELVAEPYVRLRGGNWQMAETLVPAAHWFIAGDNRSMPQEQHTAGIIAHNRIIGSLL